MIPRLSMLFAVLLATFVDGATPLPLSYASPPSRKCGEVNVFLHGLPPSDPLVIQQGYDPKVILHALMADQNTILNAGYNYRVVTTSPSNGTAYLASRLRSTKWDAVGIGYGIRGSSSEVLTRDLERIISVFREEAPKAVIVFNRSPNTTLEALRANVPLPEGCGRGRDLGFEV